MSDTNAAPQGANGGGAPAAPAAGQPPAATQQPAAGTENEGAIITIPSKQLDKRFEEERGKARNRLLKDLGYEKPDDLAAALAEWKKLREEKMSAEEKTAAQLAALAKEAEAGKTAATVASQAIDALKATLSDTQKAMLEKYAPEGSSFDVVLRTISMIRDLSAAPAAPAANNGAPPPPAPANTTPTGAAPRPGAAKTAYQQWQDMGGNNSLRGAAFYQGNREQIEATRPPPGA